MADNPQGLGCNQGTGLSVSIALLLRKRLFEARLKAINPADYQRYLLLDGEQKDLAIESSWDRVIPPAPSRRQRKSYPLWRAGLFAKVREPQVLVHIRGQMLPQMQAKMHNTTEYYILINGSTVTISRAVPRRRRHA